MKKYWILSIILLFMCAFNAQAQNNPQEENDLSIGGQMLTYPKVEWIKGNPITSFNKDSIYIVELWATWCIPCIAAMPHLNELNKKFKGKIIFIAQGIDEDSKEKVEKFVKQKGDGLDFRVAFAGPKGSDFDKKWCVPAGVSGIPATFVIQNNKLVWQTYPSKLSEEVLQLLIDGKFTEEAAEAIAAKKQ
jgi:thiol-disulfide isomerase/thioredoxin